MADVLLSNVVNTGAVSFTAAEGQFALIAGGPGAGGSEGGNISVTGGGASAGGDLFLAGGNAAGSADTVGGTAYVTAGNSSGTADGGDVRVVAGNANGSGNGGDVVIIPGYAPVAGDGGSIVLDISTPSDNLPSYVIIRGIPNSDPGIPGALYSNAGVIMISPTI